MRMGPVKWSGPYSNSKNTFQSSFPKKLYRCLLNSKGPYAFIREADSMKSQPDTLTRDLTAWVILSQWIRSWIVQWFCILTIVISSGLMWVKVVEDLVSTHSCFKSVTTGVRLTWHLCGIWCWFQSAQTWWKVVSYVKLIPLLLPQYSTRTVSTSFLTQRPQLCMLVQGIAREDPSLIVSAPSETWIIIF